SQHIDYPSPFGVVWELAEDALHLVTESISEDVVPCLPQYQPLRNTPSNYPPKLHRGDGRGGEAGEAAPEHREEPEEICWRRVRRLRGRGGRRSREGGSAPSG
ncbi:unnamed protein product, partial [Bubo scandiacus]